MKLPLKKCFGVDLVLQSKSDQNDPNPGVLYYTQNILYCY